MSEKEVQEPMASRGSKRTIIERIEGSDDQGYTNSQGGNSMDKFGKGNSSSHAADVALARKMKAVANLEVDGSKVNSQVPACPLGKNAQATASRVDTSTNQRNSDFYIDRVCDLIVGMSLYTEPTKSKVRELAHRAMYELSKVAVAGKPLWKSQNGQKFETMDNIEYLRTYAGLEETIDGIKNLIKVGDHQDFPSFKSLRVGYAPKPKPPPRERNTIESSRVIKEVKMDPLNIVQLLMNVMNAEFQLPTPFVATRECYFVRYSKKLSDDIWGVADISMEKIFPSPDIKFRRRPSGCLIKAMPNGYSKVIWVEHAVDNDEYSMHFSQVVSSGLAYGASRWVDSLVRSIECYGIPKTVPIPLHDEITEAGKESLLNLAERMMRSFCCDISASYRNDWTTVKSLLGFHEVKVKVKDIISDFGRPRGATVIFSSSAWLPTSPNILFDFLRDPTCRKKWDLLSTKCDSVREISYVIQGNDPRNRVSIIQLKDGINDMLYVQESYIDSTDTARIVYSPIHKLALSYLINGANPLYVSIEPSGFTIFPDGGMPLKGDDNSGGGSILTIAFSIMLSTAKVTPLIVPPGAIARFKNLSVHTLNGIRDALLQDNASIMQNFIASK
ncbi:homeobox-leucine zipper protein ROC1-like [Abrus precatorius]|uniref:Homeobox-leucine zipper protein ROC1-like n=1 Tax=Abrus precatorius TaxID=3816 RepID=A0A8B8L0K5_ABRPR|nr:homeobox-leucine zipper protein ROC1-like [Abrus precatorius]